MSGQEVICVMRVVGLNTSLNGGPENDLFFVLKRTV